jgi:hypothetical protein
MSIQKVQQVTPVIIKGGSRSGIVPTPIQIRANSVFQVTEEYDSKPSEWIQSASEFSVSYIESVVIGDMGAGQQFCQTSTMTHPLTYQFKDSEGNKIFTINEVTNSNGYGIQISVDLSEYYFDITEEAGSNGESWSISTLNSSDPLVYSVEVVNAGSIAVCRLLRADGEDIFLNLEPST